MAEWAKAKFLGESGLYGYQQGEIYTVQVRTPGMFYPYVLLSKEIEGATHEYLDANALRQEWQHIADVEERTVQQDDGKPGQFQPRDRAEIVSGRLKGQEVHVVSASSSLEGFYDCVYHQDTGSGHRRKEVTLAGTQLKLVQPGNGGANG